MSRYRPEPTNRDDVIDSSDIVERLEELGGEMEDAYEEYVDEMSEAVLEDGEIEVLNIARPVPIERGEWEAMVRDNGDHPMNDVACELQVLLNLQTQCEDCDDWEYGATLIRESYFKDYAYELADDIGAIPKDATWPNNCIDWEQAARELMMDYSEVEFDGVTYLIRG